MIASHYLNKEIVELLIEAGADVLKVNTKNKNALWYLFNRNEVNENFMEILTLLVQNGGKQIINQIYNTESDRKDMPTFFMVRDFIPKEYKIPVMQFLLDAGADLTLKDMGGRTLKELIEYIISNDPQYYRNQGYDKLLEFLDEYQRKKGK